MPCVLLSAIWQTALARLEAVETCAHWGNAHAAADVGAEAKHGTAEGEEGGFTTGAATDGETAVEGVEGAAEEVVTSVKSADGLRDVGFSDDDGAEGLEKSHEGGILCGRVEGEGNEATGGVDMGDVEGVFDGDGKTVEGPDGTRGGLEVGVQGARAVEGLGEEGFGEATGQLMGDGGALNGRVGISGWVGGEGEEEEEKEEEEEERERETLQNARVTSSEVRRWAWISARSARML